ncbi:DCC1-like thiol-disulfide oxidoreductase family protein [Mycobacterium sp. MYCO198283]|uniref:thiol-disulfide oxidoreductase DCC family protein n=1 Tax=Mycobacterium sp. MYCO198283 TaxID=2883505 RepID=UPI001E59937D|nr:DCC1-like thiol-disulfide oxidoreductase family protein [Mycobacterium sp. MYCO198283]MCG5433060.1 DCC1-like thiol-disulfide oxidoreductase family protein [Mycobacterium sp. MYCO198283]
MTTAAPVLLYDGVCGFCNETVRTILKLDKHGTLRFAALDSDAARGILDRHPELQGVDSVVFVENPGTAAESVSIRSTGALKVLEYLGGPWRAALILKLVPRPIRDVLYDRFAAVRYRIFGRYDTCPLPAPEVRSRFLDVG